MASLLTPAQPLLCANVKAQKKNEVIITKYPGNYTSFKIEDHHGKTIITDPFRINELVSPHIVTESHDHSDHTDTSHLQGKYRLLRSEGEWSINGVRVKGVKGYHNKKGIKPEVTNIIFVFAIDGWRIAQLGSQGRPIGNSAFKKLGKVDIVILQVFEKKDKLSVQECLQIIRRLEAKIVIPAHGDQKLAPMLAKALKGKLKAIDSGVLILDKKTMMKTSRAPAVIVLDTKDANPFY